MLQRLGQRVYRFASTRDPHTNVYGVARTLVALGTFGLLCFSHPHSIFRPGAGIAEYPICAGIRVASLFCVFGPERLAAARLTALAVLALVIVGWRPRYTGVLHWYVTASLMISGLVLDGGDQVAAIIAMLLVPVTLTDARAWHWTQPNASGERSGTTAAAGAVALCASSAAARLIALTGIYLARLQVAGIYFQAAVSKMRVEEWRDGTAVYYWFTDPWFGLPEPFRTIMLPFLASAVGVVCLTWGALAIESLLFAGLVVDRRFRPALLWMGVTFHAFIAVAHGLLGFALAMCGALVLLLRPHSQEFASLRAWSSRLFPRGPRSPLAGVMSRGRGLPGDAVTGYPDLVSFADPHDRWYKAPPGMRTVRGPGFPNLSP